MKQQAKMLTFTREQIRKKFNCTGSNANWGGFNWSSLGAWILVTDSCIAYKDRENCVLDTIMYCGHGKTGDQRYWRNNKKFNESPWTTPLFVFRKSPEYFGNGKCTYEYLGVYGRSGDMYTEKQNNRNVFIFPITKIKTLECSCRGSNSEPQAHKTCALTN